MRIQRFGVAMWIIGTMILSACGSSGVFKDDDVTFSAPGKTIDYSINLATCVKAYWSSDDLKLSITGPTGTIILEKQFVQTRNWDDTLNTDQDTKQVSVNFKVPIPDSASVGTIYSGKLIGTILCPVKNGQADGDKLSIDKSMEIRVIDAKEVRTRATNHFMDGLFSLLALAAVITVIYFVGKAVGKNKPRYRI